MQEQSLDTHDDVLRTAAATTEKKTSDKKPTSGSEKEEDPWIGKSQESEPPRR